MKKRNTSNNPLFRKIRELEEKAVEAGIIEKAQIKTSEAMCEEAWECYPIQLITDYRAGKISRQQFQQQFSNWQKSNGINFDCKGTADRNGTYLEYRGIKAEIKNGVLCWKNNTAKNLFEFKRQVDYAFNQEFNASKNASYYAGEAYEANRNGDTDRRGEMQQKQNYFAAG